MSQFCRMLCGKCGTVSAHSMESEKEGWVCVHHSPAKEDKWVLDRAKIRGTLASLDPFQLYEVAADVRNMLDYQANKIEREQMARLWIQGVA